MEKSILEMVGGETHINPNYNIRTDNTLTLYNALERIKELEKENAELKEQLEICETNVDTYYDELTKLQEQLVKTTQIGLNCSNCKWSQYDEDEMCYCCSNKDKWELKLRR